ncbi:hypothetical protein [Sulfuriroseicoccus oceanibius]|uniref:Peptidase S9 prolyl oligopeptidase catalytic domain-containing protein n=1 Tax=Sulfuriroseicoccus oceanibius TaxID=2707525 RepID=A0A6B3LEG1_9BACT|nr:hypothetical protein [Sulfuriroseicoccus oceanibius]QQL44779.1 hypothetical protein G3M56_013000 [Sulfuriroseicoccus oceanibius]
MAPLTASIDDREVRGAFLGGCNEGDFWEYAMADFRAKKATLRKIKVFVSSGTNDKLVSAAYRAKVEAACKAAGIRQLRSETYDGGHQLNHQQLKDALIWFLSEES